LKPFTFDTLKSLKNTFSDSPLGLEGVNELEQILQHTSEEKGSVIDLTLARGLDYYTGCIFEVIIPNSGIGSVSGGGRYDNLTAVFGLKDISGVGISFGIDRLYDILLDRDLFPKAMREQNHILFCHFDAESQAYCIKWANQLRSKGIPCEVYPDRKKINKQLDFANKKGITQVLIAGSNEIEHSEFTFKDLNSGAQRNMGTEKLVHDLNELNG
jgi:histidyl-tRNA synthetase